MRSTKNDCVLEYNLTLNGNCLTSEAKSRYKEKLCYADDTKVLPDPHLSAGWIDNRAAAGTDIRAVR
jgi:hypothetical protein